MVIPPRKIEHENGQEDEGIQGDPGAERLLPCQERTVLA
jgi:hypothetical protein